MIGEEQGGAAAPPVILAVVPEPDTARACLGHAALAAAAVGDTRIVALHPVVDPDDLVAAPEEIVIQQLRAAREGTAEARAAAVRAVFDAWARATLGGGKAEWRERPGAVAQAVASEAAGARLIVLARPRNLDGQDALHEAVFHAGRPLLLAPDAPPPVALAHPALAWEPEDAARRALVAALPWLRRASRVTVLVVDKTDDRPDAAEALERLKAAGIGAEVLALGGGGPVGAALLGACGRIGADALVMGSYDRPAVLEWLFGGATRDVLRDAALPVFLHA